MSFSDYATPCREGVRLVEPSITISPVRLWVRAPHCSQPVHSNAQKHTSQPIASCVLSAQEGLWDSGATSRGLLQPPAAASASGQQGRAPSDLVLITSRSSGRLDRTDSLTAAAGGGGGDGGGGGAGTGGGGAAGATQRMEALDLCTTPAPSYRRQMSSASSLTRNLVGDCT